MVGGAKTWRCDKDSDIQGRMDASATPEQVQRSHRGHGEVAAIIHLLIPYKLFDKTTVPDYQTITIQVTGVILTMAYISMKSCAGKEVGMLDRVKKFKSNEGASIMKDVNARHTHWNTRTNNRRKRVMKWATENSWTVA